MWSYFYFTLQTASLHTVQTYSSERTHLYCFTACVSRCTSESPNGTRDPLLNDVGSYFDAGLAIADTPGTFHYMCTRNNEFSMRSQKGRIVVAPVHTAAEAIGQTGGTLSLRLAFPHTQRCCKPVYCLCSHCADE